MSFLEGVFSVLPTPFHDDASLDMDSMRRVIDLFIEGGVSGLTALGVTGEVARLTEKERQTVLDTVIDHAAGRVPVVAGTTAEGFAHLSRIHSPGEKRGRSRGDDQPAAHGETQFGSRGPALRVCVGSG